MHRATDGAPDRSDVVARVVVEGSIAGEKFRMPSHEREQIAEIVQQAAGDCGDLRLRIVPRVRVRASCHPYLPFHVPVPRTKARQT